VKGKPGRVNNGSDETGGHQNIWTLGPTPGVQSAAASFGAVTVTFTAYAGSES
jgi:hypothetical protein